MVAENWGPGRRVTFWVAITARLTSDAIVPPGKDAPASLFRLVTTAGEIASAVRRGEPARPHVLACFGWLVLFAEWNGYSGQLDEGIASVLDAHDTRLDPWEGARAALVASLLEELGELVAQVEGDPEAFADEVHDVAAVLALLLGPFSNGSRS